MEGLVIKLSPHLYFGPPPKTRDDLKHLINVLGISLIVNICPKTNERTKGGIEKAEFYMELLSGKKKNRRDDDDDEEEDLFVFMKRISIDMTSFDPKGRNKGLKQESVAQQYVSYARVIQKETEKKKAYIHGLTGVMDEAYVAFAIWKMRASTDSTLEFPVDLLMWIKDNDYEWLFNDDNDKKELLSVVLNQTTRDLRKTHFFKRMKSNDD